MRKEIKCKAFIFIIAFFIIFIVFPSGAKAEDDKAPHFCVICSSDEQTYKMEKQFVERIKIIKSILGDSIDEVALAATVLHKEDALEAVRNRYEEKFKKSDYKKTMETLFAGEEGNKDEATEEKDLSIKSGLTAEKVDLLNAAAIIMADSAGWTGKYNEEKYQEALARDGLITGNDFVNFIFCEAGKQADHMFTVGNIIYHFATGQNVQAEIDRTSTRWNDMQKICESGYVGGVYNLTAKDQPNDELRKLKREEVAEEIINLIHYYRLIADSPAEEDDECEPVATTGDYANWKQYGESWSNISMGGSDSIGSIGCLATSVAIQIARSGTKITSSSFDPGVFVKSLNKHGGFVSGGNFTWTGHQKIAPNWKTGDSKSVNISSTAALANTLSKELSTGAEGKYQKFIVLQIRHSGSSQHWVAVDTVSGNKVTIFDPGAEGNTLDKNYSGWVVESYRVLYATDVLKGQTGSSSSSSSSSSTPDNYNSSGYKARLEGLKNYEQCGPKLSSVSLGNSNVCSSGCMVASLGAIQYMFTGQETDMKKLINDMIKEGEWSNSAAGMGTPYFDNPSNSPLITKNWGLSGETLNSGDGSKIKEGIIKSLKEGKKILLNLGGPQTTYSTTAGHFLMLDHYNNKTKKIYIFNPGGRGTGYLTESQLMSEVIAHNKYGPWAISSSNVTNPDSCGDGTGTGNIIIPKEYGHGGYTVTYYLNSDNDWNWDPNSNQGNLYYNYWSKKPKFKDGIAIYQDRYLIACTETFGKVGDKVDFFLEDGTRIPTIIADAKDPDDPDYNKWGHNNGQNVLEFEVLRSRFNQNGNNPGTGNWYKQWGGKRVASATNLGSIWK